MKLLVIESSGKQETIQKYLGPEWEVFATKGHVRDLPAKSLGININKNFEPEYVIMPDKQDIVKKLKDKVKKADEVYLATDPDREGEAISHHLAYILGFEPDKPCRVVFNEITKDVILNNLKNPRKIDSNLVNAQQARRVLDRLVGYKISPILCKKIQNNLSAGRVQSVALKLVVDREKDILNFKPEEYWTINAQLEKQGAKPQFKALLSSFKNKKLKIKNEQEKNEIIENLKNETFILKSLKKQVTKSHAPAPFTTSTMQQDALNKLGMNLKKTTSCAQELYEGVKLGNEGKVALVTYIRTDSVRVSEEAQKKAKEFIINKFGKDFVPSKYNIYKSKGDIQDAHEAIRPVNLNRTPESIRQYTSSENYKLYKLIYERFLASQMSDALYDSVSLEVMAGEYKFKTSGKTPKFLGYTAIYQEHKDKDVDENDEKEAKLPVLNEGEVLNCLNLLSEQKFTKPSPRYTEASLVKAMEENGIGRPATYTPTITVLSTRKYIEKEGKFLKPTELGFKTDELLEKYFSKIVNVDFTAQMETRLDEVSEGKYEWQQIISSFYNFLLPQLRNANLDSEKFTVPVELKVSNVKCEKCGSYMIEREGKFGKFLACPNYPNCKNVQSLKPQLKPIAICPKCGKNVFLKKSKKGTVYYACEDYTNCKFMSWDKPSGEKCTKCGDFIVEKQTKNGVTYKCNNPNCDYLITKEDNNAK